MNAESLNPRNGNQPRPGVVIALLPLIDCGKRDACKNTHCIIKGGSNVPIIDANIKADKLLEISCFGY